MESGSPTSRAVRPYDAKILEEQIQVFLREVKCPEDLDEAKIFPYLRSLSSSKIIEAQTRMALPTSHRQRYNSSQTTRSMVFSIMEQNTYNDRIQHK
ncbi:hypothetical protein N7481_003296 [Penicillium waksmanii]|uniref:uncharacterized protein n=1 Tax=Penicillium waksmanii TaxID=69791 RepID=UPI0025471272|nr:uncharacterized protein N7481_003296 [Penicillium waksmanii]KAJ5988086.1 hypothetical protein N7481_003296 [Penicillium waksmanii]